MKMMNAASTSKSSFIVEVDEAYPYPSHVIAPNFVTMKLSGKDTYNVWETQILCLLKSHHMFGFVEGQFPSPAWNGKGKEGDIDAWIASDSLVKGWILGSLSDGVAKKVVNRLKSKHKNTDFTAKDVWDELQHSYGPWVHEQAAETISTPRQVESVIEVNPVSQDAKSKDKPAEEKTRNEETEETWYDVISKRRLYYSILKGNTRSVIGQLRQYSLNPWDKITNNGNTILHVAVGSSNKHHELLEKLLEMSPEEYTLPDLVNSDGSSVLHVAAIGGNTQAVNMLVERNPKLLLAKDKEGHIPLALSVSNMHTKTSHCLFEHMKVHGSGNYFYGETGKDLVVLAISCQDFRLAKMIITKYDGGMIPISDDLLTALAQNFPRELKFWERRDFAEIGMKLNPYLDRLVEFSDSTCWRRLSLAFVLLFMGRS